MKVLLEGEHGPGRRPCGTRRSGCPGRASGSGRLRWTCRTCMTSRLRWPSMRALDEGHDFASVIPKEAVVEIAHVPAGEPVCCVVALPTNDTSSEVSKNAVVRFHPPDNITAGPIDRFHASNLGRGSDRARKWRVDWTWTQDQRLPMPRSSSPRSRRYDAPRCSRTCR